MNSLERSIVIGLATLLLLAFSFLLWISVSAVKNLSEAYVITRLEHDSEALLSSLWTNPKGHIRLREGRITPIYQQPLSGHYFQFNFSDGAQINSRSLWDETLTPTLLAVGEVKTHRVKGPGQQQLLMHSAGYEKLGLQFTLTVAEDMKPLSADIQYFQAFALVLLSLTALTIILIQRYILRKGFRALDQVRNEVNQVSSGQAQLLHEMGPSEIRPLTIEINRLLKQLQQRLRRSRDALGNLAHALKAPLSLMTHDIDNLPLSAPDKNNLADKLSRISALIERELKRARLAGEDVGQHFNPARDIADLVEALKLMYRDRNLDITTGPLPDSILPFDHEDMLELLGNLLDNACKWADSTVHVQLSINSDMQIRISDNGPGVSEEGISRMTQRGSRIDEREDGYGLGLAIVNDLINDYHGSISFSRSGDLGGLEVSVNLPLPQGNTSN